MAIINVIIQTDVETTNGHVSYMQCILYAINLMKERSCSSITLNTYLLTELYLSFYTVNINFFFWRRSYYCVCIVKYCVVLSEQLSLFT